MATETFDVTKHLLVPKHELVDEKEKQQLMEAYEARIEDFPKILLTDPAIQHLSPKEGNIIKILRNSATAGDALFYRVVVSE